MSTPDPQLPEYRYVARRAQRRPEQIICGYEHCGGLFGTTRGRLSRFSWEGIWRFSADGIWYLDERRRHYGRRPKMLNPVINGDVHRSGQRLWEASPYPLLPCVARCPKCKWPNLLDPDALDIHDPTNLQQVTDGFGPG